MLEFPGEGVNLQVRFAAKALWAWSGTFGPSLELAVNLPPRARSVI